MRVEDCYICPEAGGTTGTYPNATITQTGGEPHSAVTDERGIKGDALGPISVLAAAPCKTLQARKRATSIAAQRFPGRRGCGKPNTVAHNFRPRKSSAHYAHCNAPPFGWWYAFGLSVDHGAKLRYQPKATLRQRKVSKHPLIVRLCSRKRRGGDYEPASRENRHRPL